MLPPDLAKNMRTFIVLTMETSDVHALFLGQETCVGSPL